MKRTSRFALPALLSLPVALILMFASSRAAVAQNPPDLNGGTDHFTCYDVIEQNLHPPATISLTDECGVTLTGVQAFTPLQICNPVAKTVGGVETPITEPDAHLTLYELTQKLPANPRKVVVNNQFGSQTLRVAAPKLIAVPTVKNGIGTLRGVEDELSHFTCYEAAGKRILVSADILDQFLFASETILVHVPVYFCSPAIKTSETETSQIARNEDHLVLYKVTPSVTPANISTVTALNQFESNVLTIGPLHFLAVPSEVISCGN
jgi:hypothetical protein